MLPPIKLRDILPIMERLGPTGEPIPFSLVAVTASRRDPHTSGRIIVFKDVILARMLKYVDPDISLAQRREFTPQLQKAIPSKFLRNSVRRIYRLQDRSFRNVHIRLIMSFNGRLVIP